jgi:hypothetical protein
VGSGEAWDGKVCVLERAGTGGTIVMQQSQEFHGEIHSSVSP